MYIGIDLGTSGVKTILTNESGELIGSTTSPLSVSRPKPLWSEQEPEDWWTATCDCLDQLSASHDLSEVKAIGLSGQMHGATLLDGNGKVIRPAILWNDGRCEAECREIEATLPEVKTLSGNLVMPGFTAPKLLWVKHHEPEHFAKVKKVLLPKDYLRYRLTGEYASDMSDAAGTIWMNTQKREWDDALLGVCGLTREHMPSLFEGNAITGYLSDSLAQRWKMNAVAVAAGGGDNAAGAIGCGIVDPGHAMLSLGTSGVYFAVTNAYKANPQSAVHSFCHALPHRWHLMSVMLSAASCLQWFASEHGYPDVGTMLNDIEHNTAPSDAATPIFLPYLTGERTPHNNPNAQASFIGISASTTRAHMARAVIEGVSMALADGMDAVHACGVKPDYINLIGGGAKSPFWRQMLADVSGLSMAYRTGGDVGPALGAARLAQLSVNEHADLPTVCAAPPLESVYEPNAELNSLYAKKREIFRALYPALAPFFSTGEK